MRKQSITIGALIDLSTRPVIKWAKLRMLTAEYNYESKNRAYFNGMAQTSRAGVADCDKRLINLQSQINDLEV